MASGWNLWVWLQCIGVVSGCCCKEVYDILTKIINFPYSSCISSFFGSSIPTSFFIFKMFFRSCLCYFFTKNKQTLLKEHSRWFKKNRDHANIIIKLYP